MGVPDRRTRTTSFLIFEVPVWLTLTRPPQPRNATMSIRNKYTGVFDDSTINLIHSKAKQLANQEGFSSTDQKDIEQDLAVYLLDKLTSFDPGKAELNTFVFTVVNQRITMMIRARGMQKRDSSKTISLNEPIPSDPEGNTTLLDITDHEDFMIQTGLMPRSSEDQLILQIDTAHLIATLPEKLQEVCRMLMQESVAEVAERLGVHRDTVYRRLSLIRKHFTDNMLGDPRDV